VPGGIEEEAEMREVLGRLLLPAVMANPPL